MKPTSWITASVLLFAISLLLGWRTLARDEHQAGDAARVGAPTLVANDDKCYTRRGSPVTIDVLKNDSAAADDSLRITIATQPVHGTAAINGRAVTYTPKSKKFYGIDRLTYEVTDGRGSVASAAVIVHVVALVLDVNGDTDISDDVDGFAGFLPGEIEGKPVLSSGDSFRTAKYLGQRLCLVVQPVGPELTAVEFQIKSVTSYPGYSGNTSDPKIEGAGKTNDFSFRELYDHNQITVTRASSPESGGCVLADRAWAEFWCKDYAAAARVKATLFFADAPPLIVE